MEVAISTSMVYNVLKKGIVLKTKPGGKQKGESGWSRTQLKQ